MRAESDHAEGCQRDPTVSVVVACSRPWLIPAIADALAAGDATNCELLVAGDVALIPAREWPIRTVLLPCRDPHPNTRRALALEHACAPVIAFLDDDAIPTAMWASVAAALPHDGTTLWTGPETPVRTSIAARLAYALACSWWAEGTRAHVETRDLPVGWSDVPFCNLVIARSFLDVIGPPSSEVPWDADDFELCDRARRAGGTFRNVPDLAITHDRYPDRLTGWLTRKIHDRRRTGEKLISHPHLYGRVPGVVAVALAPWLGGMAIASLSPPARRTSIRCAIAGYFVLVGATATRAAQVVDPEHPPTTKAAAALVGLHLTTTAAFYVGLLRGVVKRLILAGRRG